MNIPNKISCFQLLKRAGTYEHIAAHSIQVCRVSLSLCDRLTAENNNLPLNRELILASALLHDITKTRSLETGEPHAETGGVLLAGKGFPEVGEIVRQHVKLDHFSEDSPVTETEIVNYADKRVLHDTIATLDERMAYILKRYAKTPALKTRLENVWKETVRMERKIFSALPFSPDVIGDYLPKEGLREQLAEYTRTPGPDFRN